jgi:SAM-dependent methyltransferase
VDARLQRRVQRYGWDRAVDAYARHWLGPLAGMQAEVLDRAAPRAGERVLDVACGTGVLALAAARAVCPTGHVLGVDLSGAMVGEAQRRAQAEGLAHATFVPMDAEQLSLPAASIDLALCSLGLMYLPDPDAALRELHRVLRPGGRAVLAVWGEREHCGWAPVFGIVDDEVRSEVCPLFFALGHRDALATRCASAGLCVTAQHRRSDTIVYADGNAACDAALVGGPVALAWSRFDEVTRERVRTRYREAIAPFARGSSYHLPAEFVIVTVRRAPQGDPP